MKQVIGHQGEIRIVKIDALPADMQAEATDKGQKGFIISHSENGNHHLLVGDNVAVIERQDVPSGMQILYGIVSGDAELVQDAATPHDGFSLPEGFYEFRISREYDPFAQQARRVAD